MDDVALVKLKTPVSPAANVKTVTLHMGVPAIDGSLVQGSLPTSIQNRYGISFYSELIITPTHLIAGVVAGVCCDGSQIL